MGAMKHMWHIHIDGLVQDCSISRALPPEILQFCTKPSIYNLIYNYYAFLNNISGKKREIYNIDS